MNKLKLSLEDLTVLTFAAEVEREEAKGTVLANSYETEQRVCYTPVIDCYTVRWICFTKPEGGCA